TAEAVISPPDDGQLLRIRLDGEQPPRVMEVVTDEATLAMWERIGASPGPIIARGAAPVSRLWYRNAEAAPVDADVYLDPQHLQNAMIAPLRGETRAIGMLMVADRMGEGTSFSKQDLRLF